MLGISSTTKLSNRPKNELAAHMALLAEYWQRDQKCGHPATKISRLLAVPLLSFFAPTAFSDE
jgi:hypothetical protein